MTGFLRKYARLRVPGRFLTLMAAAFILFQANTAFSANYQNFDRWQGEGFRGFNVPTYLNEDDWQVFESTGANLGRVFMNLPRVPGTNRFQLPANAYSNIDKMVAQAQKRGFKIVVTFNPQPKAPDSTYWFNAAQQDSIIDVIAAFADRYSGNNAFAGFDIINEPYPVTRGHPEAPKNFDGPAAWRAFASRIITAVRRQDPTRVIIYEFPYWSGLYETLQPLPFDGVVYSSHWYTPHDVTHQGISGRPLGVSYPSPANSKIGLWNKDVIRAGVAKVRQFQQTYRLPVYFGEFSCTRKAPGQTSFNYDSDVMSVFDEYGWSWSYHAFRQAPEWDAELSRGVNGEPRSVNTNLMQRLRQSFSRN